MGTSAQVRPVLHDLKAGKRVGRAQNPAEHNFIYTQMKAAS
ncbi:unnamed protein product, partial [Didymodactylos carnosus]